MVCGRFAYEMHLLATGAGTPTFDIDIVREMKVFLPDGTRLSNDLKEARDQLARLATGDPNASYNSLGAADKAKANAFMALLSQETEKAATTGVQIGMSRDGKQPAFEQASYHIAGGGSQPVRSLTISGSPQEGFSIHYMGSYPAPFVMYADDKGQMQPTPMGPRHVCEYEMEMHISQASFNQIAQVDWAQYDPDPVNGVLYDLHRANHLSEGYQMIPQNFLLDVDVEAGFTIQSETVE